MRLLYLLSLANLAGLAQAFRNPILPGFNPDPSLLVVGEEYFVTTSTFEIFPGHPIYHSKDLVDWKLIGAVTSMTCCCRGRRRADGRVADQQQAMRSTGPRS
jgi:beta-xylosidase